MTDRSIQAFTRGIPRPAILAAAVLGFRLMPVEALSAYPSLCLWRYLLRIPACPACGSTRALVAFFHGQFAQAASFNRNVMITAPLILALLLSDLFRFFCLQVRTRH
jgi:hypothetical protein